MAAACSIPSAYALRLDTTLLAIGALEHLWDRYVQPRVQ
jgi:hypothetical protein